MSKEDDDDPPALSEETMAILAQFIEEQQQKKDKMELTEDWQLSQFWYDEETCKTLANSAAAVVPENGHVALISCPSVYKPLKKLLADTAVEVKLFEYDQRFAAVGSDFEFYDYKEPGNVKVDYKNMFDVVLVDPPFLSEECLSKTAVAIKYVSKPNAKIVLCTGAIMAELSEQLLNVKKCNFKPVHSNNLSNEFICMTNFGEIETCSA